MDLWLKFFFVVVGSILIPTAFLLVGQIWKLRIRVVRIEADIVAIQQRCIERGKTIGKAWDQLDKMARNIVRIGTKFELQDLE